MAELRLYRDIVCFSQNNDLNTHTTTNITPVGLSAYTSGATGTIETLTPVEDSVGRYYVVIDLIKYDLSAVNQLIWTVKYTSSAPLRNLITRFKVDYRFDMGSELQIEILDNSIELVI